MIKHPAWFFILAISVVFFAGLTSLILLPQIPIQGKRLPKTPQKLDFETGKKIISCWISFLP